MFVSHQWVTRHHPDPKMEQLDVLQQALQNLLAGRSHVCLPPAVELCFGRLKCPSAADFNAKPLFLWYDYFSCPQSTSADATSNRQMAIDCIPSYVARCYFFVILCPFVERAPGQTLNYSTWEARGWCRLEYMARCLAREDGGLITIKSPHHQMLVADLRGVLKASIVLAVPLVFQGRKMEFEVVQPRPNNETIALCLIIRPVFGGGLRGKRHLFGLGMLVDLRCFKH